MAARPTALSLSLVASGILAACTAPAPPAAEAAAPRDVQLVESPAAEAVKVSDLEAGRPLRARHETHEAPTPAPTEALLGPVAGPTLSTTTMPAADLAEAPLSAAPAADEPVVVVGTGVQPMYSETGVSWAGGRGPGVMIRGGRGGPRDDCDLHRPGGATAVNRLIPVPQGISLRGPATLQR
ncbi:MAG: hypothetical protein AB7L66_05605 [Gemmatimonadales bacterium]